MTVEELVAQLQDFPGYWTVDVAVTHTDDELDELGQHRRRVSSVELVQTAWSHEHATPVVVLS